MKCISQNEAKRIMDNESGYIILDVRREDEFELGHIPNAVNLPLENIEDLAEEELKDKSQMLLVYCRSGRRSKMAAGILDTLGYTNVLEFGGILDWQYEIVK